MTYYIYSVFAIVLSSENCQFSKHYKRNRHENAYAIAWVVLYCSVGMAVPLNSTTYPRFSFYG